MSDLALFSQGGNTLPAHLRNLELDATTKALMGGGGTGKRISIRGGVFRMIVGGKEVAQNDERAMNVVVVRSAEKTSRSYYQLLCRHLRGRPELCAFMLIQRWRDTRCRCEKPTVN